MQCPAWEELQSEREDKAASHEPSFEFGTYRGLWWNGKHMCVHRCPLQGGGCGSSKPTTLQGLVPPLQKGAV